MHENASPDIIIALVGNKLDMDDNRQVQTEVKIKFLRKPNNLQKKMGFCILKYLQKKILIYKKSF